MHFAIKVAIIYLMRLLHFIFKLKSLIIRTLDDDNIDAD